MRNLKLTLCYDGTNYHGWQMQNNAVTVQQKLQEAIEQIFKEKIQVNGCSRTDAGVHAVKYVCSFKTCANIPLDKVPIALNTKLPDDIRVLSCCEVEDAFHARFSTKSKTYRYVINNSDTADVFNINHQWHIPKKLDIRLMKKEAKSFLGKHNFKSFCAAAAQVSSYERTVYNIKIKSKKDIIEIYITADGYLYNMVRIIVGTLVKIGLSKGNYTKISDILKRCDRTCAAMTAPPQGLSLFDVIY